MSTPTKKTLDRLKRDLSLLERKNRNGDPSQPANISQNYRYFMTFHCTSDISAATMPSCGYGQGTMQDFSGGSFVNGSLSVRIYNITDKNIAAGAYVMCGWMYGQWFVIVPDSCNHLTGGS